MSSSRLDAFRAMVQKNPANLQARFGLANEAVKAGSLDEAREHYAHYLDRFDDEGNGWARYAELLETLGRSDEARAALLKGIEAAERHGHPSLAADLADRLDDDG